MKPDLQQRIVAIKAECEEILKLSEKATPGPWEVLADSRPWEVWDKAGQHQIANLSPRRAFSSGMSTTKDNARFIAASRNVSPAMARVVVMVIDDGVAQGDDVFLEIIADRWEGKP